MPRFVKFLSLWAAATIALGACASTGGATGDTSDTSGGSGEIRPFRASDLRGRPVDLAAHLGKDVVFISFWATYCEPCKTEMPYLQAFHDKYKDRGLTIVSIALDGPDTEALVAPYIRSLGYTFPVVLDRDGAIAQALNPTASAPYSILVARDGKVDKRISGFQSSEAEALEKELVTLIERPAR